jgi:hypothetical protein
MAKLGYADGARQRLADARSSLPAGSSVVDCRHAAAAAAA